MSDHHRHAFWENLLKPIEKVDKARVKQALSPIFSQAQLDAWDAIGLFDALDDPLNPLTGPTVNAAADMIKGIWNFLDIKTNK